jgi:hypothetical protein
MRHGRGLTPDMAFSDERAALTANEKACRPDTSWPDSPRPDWTCPASDPTCPASDPGHVRMGRR